MADQGQEKGDYTLIYRKYFVEKTVALSDELKISLVM